MPVIECNEMRNIEKTAVENGCTYLSLMESAGRKTAEFTEKIINSKNFVNILIICGKGNNGGDGFVAARLLSENENNYNISVILADGKPTTDDAKTNFRRIPKCVEIIEYNTSSEKCFTLIKNADMIIDAIYGIGFRGELNEKIKALVDACNQSKNAVRISVDLPSGAVCDSGKVNNGCFSADYTVTFTALKPLHVLYPSADFCGDVRIEYVGIPYDIIKNSNFIMETTDEYIKSHPLEKKKKSVHKGINGTLFSLCGSYGMAGAAIMSGAAALRTGVGLVRAAVPKSIYELVASQLPEAVFMPLKQNDDGTVSIEEFNKILYDVLEKSTALLMGCGLGTGDDLSDLISLLIENSTKPIVLDADGINSICMNIDILKKAKSPVILTPHPGEMARLIFGSTKEVQNNRYNIAKEFSEKYNVILVLKGANTLVAVPGGKVYVNMTGNNGMAKGGSGDVLAGMIGSFLAQGMSAEQAAVYGVYYHGLAGDLCSEKFSSRAMLPTDIISELKYIF